MNFKEMVTRIYNSYVETGEVDVVLIDLVKEGVSIDTINEAREAALDLAYPTLEIV